jgi:predicted aspartyl protease
VTVTLFDRDLDLIIVGATLWGPSGERAELKLALDTGSSETLLMPEVTDALGYSARQGDQLTVIRSAIGSERGYMLRVVRFAALGFTVPDFRVHVHDLPEGFGIDGLLGLSFLRNLNYEIRSGEGRILTERID